MSTPQSTKYILLMFTAVALSACHANIQALQSSDPTVGAQECRALSSTPNPTAGLASNQMSVVIGCGLPNRPCVTVTVCEPGTSNCQTISNVLLDTGSYGLRLFSCTHGLSLPAVDNGAGAQLASCVSYLDSTTQWGGVYLADVKLGGETAPSVPIHMIDPNFGGGAQNCGDSPEASPQLAGYNGILGVGLKAQDCGATCATQSDSGLYYACAGGSCSESSVPLNKQITNPMTKFAINNNGLKMSVPAVGPSGALSVTGTITFGVNTQANNTPAGGSVSIFKADANDFIRTQYPVGGSTVLAFLDSGSNGLFFPVTASTPTCDPTSIAAGFYCPTNTVNLSANIRGTGVSPAQQLISFQIANAFNFFIVNNPNMVFNNLGGDLVGYFDWGMPFFLGRTIYMQFESTTSPLGSGPYWAF